MIGEKADGVGEASVRHDNIPDELKTLDQWVGWSWKQVGEKWTKVPYDLKNGASADSTDPSTWSSYSATRGHENIGFVFSKDDPYCGIDLDACISEDGEMSKGAARIVKGFDSYSEVSPSGRGVKVWVKGSVPGERRKNPVRKMEIYSFNRFFTVTGRIFGESVEIQKAQDRVNDLYSWLFPPSENGSSKIPESGYPTNYDISDADILSHAYRAENREKFMRLWNGNTEGYGSHSEADLALCSMLAFWTGPDPSRIESLFSQSDLCREKWLDRETYRRHTIEKALEGRTEFYNPTTGGSYTLPGKVSTDEALGRGVSPPTTAPLPKAPPFPLESLPESCRDFVREGAASVGCPVEFVALPVLSVLSQGVGASRVVQIKRGWRESAALFLAVVGEPGTKKTPPAKMATRPVWRRHFTLEREFYRKHEEYEAVHARYEADSKDAKRNGATPPPEPEEPNMERCVTVDVTVEALIDMLADNPRGILVDRDELTGWVRAMDQYKGGKGSDKQHWLSLWSNSSITVDRKNQGGRPISVEHPTVTLSGSIQPRMLKELGETSEEGMIERFLFAYPEHQRSRFTYDEVSFEAEKRYEDLYNALTRFEMAEDPASGRTEPNVTPMAPEARELFALCSDRISSEMEEPGFPHRLRGAFSKLEGYLARLALILALCRCIETDDVEQVEREDVQAAHALVSFFAAHARRIYGEMGGATPEEMFAAEFIEFLREEAGGSWNESSENLVNALKDAGVHETPDSADALTKKLLRIAKQHPTLAVKPTRKRNEEGKVRRVLEIRDVNFGVHGVHAFTEEGK